MFRFQARRKFSFADFHFLSLAILVTFSVLGCAYLLNRGLDFTDEGYYLNTLNPQNSYNSQVTFEGKIFSILRLGELNVLQIRVITFVVLVTLGAVFGWRFTSLPVFTNHLEGAYSTKAIRVAIALTASLFSLLYLYLWLPTPSYNTVALVGLLTFALGVIERRENPILGGTLIALALFLSYVGKPTTAVILIFILVWFAIKKHMGLVSLTGVGVSFLAMLMLFSNLVFSHPLEILIRQARSLNEGTAGSFGQAPKDFEDFMSFPLRLLPYPVSPQALAYLLVSCLALHFWIKAAVTQAESINVRENVAFSAVILVLASGHFILGNSEGKNFVLFLPITVLAAIVAKQKLARKALPKEFVMFLFLPLAYVFGTNNNYFEVAIPALVFTLPFALMLISSMTNGHEDRRNNLFLIRYLILNAVVILMVIGHAIQNPYRQQEPLLSANSSFSSNSVFYPLMLDKNSQEFLTGVERVKKKFIREGGSGVIDLSGELPIVAFALETKSLGSFWLVGGHPASGHFVETKLREENNKCLNSAWIVKSDGERRLEEKLIAKLGLGEFSTNYTKVYSWFNSGNQTTIDLYAPIRTLSLQGKERC